MARHGGTPSGEGGTVLDAVLDALAERIAEKLDARHPVQSAAPAPAQLPAAEWLTCAQAAARLGVKPKTLEQWRSEGCGPKWSRLGKRSVRYSVQDVDAFARRGRP